MIYKEEKEIIKVIAKLKNVSAIYKGTKLVWQGARSCFGSGGWNNDLPWDNNDGWVS